MSGFELNKIAGAVLMAGLLAMVAGKVAEIVYHPEEKTETRGFAIDVPESEGTATIATAAAEPPLDMAAIKELLAHADAEAGKKLTGKCAACHSFEKGGPTKVGPNLWGIVNNKKAHLDGFAYSPAMLAKGGHWAYEDLFHFLKKPKDFVPGTKMAFPGFSKPAEIANVVAYLRTQSDSPAPLP